MGDCTSMTPKDLTFEDLRVHYGTGRAYTISGKGRDRVMGYRTGMQCNMGDIEISEWRAMVRELIVRKGEQDLFEQLYAYMKEHNYAMMTKSQLDQEALELHAARIFDDPLWVDFIPFNERFRPETLQAVKLVCVIPECCKKAGFITDARYRERTPPRDENYCPHCGRWTKISLVDYQQPKGDNNND